MKTIELNDQQVDTLKLLLETETIDENTSKSYNAIINQILDKLNEE